MVSMSCSRMMSEDKPRTPPPSSASRRSSWPGIARSQRLLEGQRLLLVCIDSCQRAKLAGSRERGGGSRLATKLKDVSAGMLALLSNRASELGSANHCITTVYSRTGGSTFMLQGCQGRFWWELILYLAWVQGNVWLYCLSSPDSMNLEAIFSRLISTSRLS